MVQGVLLPKNLGHLCNHHYHNSSLTYLLKEVKLLTIREKFNTSQVKSTVLAIVDQPRDFVAPVFIRSNVAHEIESALRSFMSYALLR